MYCISILLVQFNLQTIEALINLIIHYERRELCWLIISEISLLDLALIAGETHIAAERILVMVNIDCNDTIHHYNSHYSLVGVLNKEIVICKFSSTTREGNNKPEKKISLDSLDFGEN